MKIKDRVAEAALYLDENFDGWEKKVNLKTLNLSNPCKCVAAALFSSYYDAPHPFKDEFNKAFGGHLYSTHPKLKKYNKAWKKEIRARRTPQ